MKNTYHIKHWDETFLTFSNGPWSGWTTDLDKAQNFPTRAKAQRMLSAVKKNHPTAYIVPILS